jgi:hypothetical protein
MSAAIANSRRASSIWAPPSEPQRPLRPPGTSLPMSTPSMRLQLAHATRDLAMFDLAIDSKLRGCDLVRLRISDVPRLGHQDRHVSGPAKAV